MYEQPGVDTREVEMLAVPEQLLHGNNYSYRRRSHRHHAIL